MNMGDPHAKYYKMCLQPEFDEHMAAQQTNRWKRKMEKGMMGLSSGHEQTESSGHEEPPQNFTRLTPKQATDHTACKVQINNLTRTVHQYETALGELQGKVDSLENVKEELESLKREAAELRVLNRRLQERILEGFDGQPGNRQEIEREPTPGFICKVTNRIYLGMNQWLPMQSWNLITSDCKSPAQFIRQMMVAMFPYQTLLQQTVTGKGSNRNRSGPPSEGRLDPEKVLAIKSIFQWYLINVKKMSLAQADSHVEKTKAYMSKKIAQMKDSESKAQDPLIVQEYIAQENPFIMENGGSNISYIKESDDDWDS
ncbi:uncharacterized protein LOC117173063 isoform X2 [Belonocnema kinseyi]|uniref:uncharacterized protein LOC117173063 isoform X2 n=1 Tax=Belonocnema kinseyi TaxID=2817044 RepID=UPI00143DE566|nr:uncharacterized protein LOC117173063 isoform X2 [Belonocnema kinseyi]